MKVEMLFYMETEDDDEPMTDDQWRKELHSIVNEVANHINKKHGAYLKNADGEFAFNEKGEYTWKEKSQIKDGKCHCELAINEEGICNHCGGKVD